MIPSLGRSVHFVLPENGEIRPATIVRVHADPGSVPTEDTLVNLQVIMDGDGRTAGDPVAPLSWKTSVAQGVGRGQWFDPLRADAPKAAIPRKGAAANPPPAAPAS